jgi:hypothetical protein
VAIVLVVRRRWRLVVIVVMIVAMVLLGIGSLYRLDDGGAATGEDQHSGEKNSG